IEGMARLGIDITHVYGLTEVYGPAAVAVKRDSWSGESLSEQTRLNGRQGVRYVLQEGMTVLGPATLAETPADGQTPGEIRFRGDRGRADRALQEPARRLQGAEGSALRGDPEDLHRQDSEVHAARAGEVRQRHRVRT